MTGEKADPLLDEIIRKHQGRMFLEIRKNGFKGILSTNFEPTRNEKPQNKCSQCLQCQQDTIENLH